MARGRNQLPSTSNKAPVKTKTNVAGEKEHHDNSSSEEITLPQASRTTRRSLTVAKEQIAKDKGKKETESTATINPKINRGRLRSRSRKNVQSPAGSSNLSSNLDNDSIDTENVELTLTDTAESSSLANRREEAFLDINNVANVVEIGDFSQISTTLTESSDCEDKQIVTIADKLTSFEGRGFGMSSTDEDSQSQCDSALVQQDESSSNQEEILTVIETTDSVGPDDEILLEISTDQSVKINPSLYAFASPPHGNKQGEDSVGESSLHVIQKDSPTPLSNIKSSLRNRDTPTPDRIVSSPETLHVHTNSKAPRTYQNRRKTKAITSTNDQKTTHAILNPPTTSKITESQDKSNIIQEKSSGRQDTPPNITECRRSQRNRIIKYDVRDLLNKNRKSKIQIESKVVLKPKPSESSPTPSIKDKGYEGYDTDRSSMLDSPQVFKGFSDSDSSKMSPITIKEKICTPEPSLSSHSEKPAQKKEVSIQTKEIGIELTGRSTEKLENLITVITKASTSKDGSPPKEAKKISNEVKVTNKALAAVGSKTSTQEFKNKANSIIGEIELPKSKSKGRVHAAPAPARSLRNKQVTETAILMSNDDTTDEDDLSPPPLENMKKPTRTQEIFAKCLKRSQRVESLIERNISVQSKGKKFVNSQQNKLPPKLNSSRSVADFEHFVEQVINLADDSSSGDSFASGNQTTEKTVRQTRSKGKQPFNFETKISASSGAKVSEKIIVPSVSSAAKSPTISKTKQKTKTVEVASDGNKSDEDNEYSEIVFQIETQDEGNAVLKENFPKLDIFNSPKSKEAGELASGKTRLSQKKVKHDCMISTPIDTKSCEDVKGEKTTEVMVLASSGELQTVSINVPKSNEIKTCSRTRSSQKKCMQESENVVEKEDVNKKLKSGTSNKNEVVKSGKASKTLSTEDLKDAVTKNRNKESTESSQPAKAPPTEKEGDKDSKDDKTSSEPQNIQKKVEPETEISIKQLKEDEIGDEKKIPLKKRSSQRKVEREENSGPKSDSNASDSPKLSECGTSSGGESNLLEVVDIEKLKSLKDKKVVKLRASLRMEEKLNEGSCQTAPRNDEHLSTKKVLQEENKIATDLVKETKICEKGESQARIHTRSSQKHSAEVHGEDTVNFDLEKWVQGKISSDEKITHDNERSIPTSSDKKDINFEKESTKTVYEAQTSKLYSDLDKFQNSLPTKEECATTKVTEDSLIGSSAQEKSDDCYNLSDQSGSIIILDDDVSSKIESSDSEKAADDKLIKSITVSNAKPIKKRKRQTDIAPEIDSEDDIPLKKRVRKITRTCIEVDSDVARKLSEELNVSEAIMEIIVGDHANKTKNSEQSEILTGGEMHNSEESKQIETVDLTVSDLKESNTEPITETPNKDGILEENLKCNKISEETDQSKGPGDSSKVSSQIAGSSATNSEKVENKTEEISPSKTDEIKATESSESIKFSRVADKANKEDLKEVSPQKIETPEKKKLGSRRSLRSNKKENQTSPDVSEIVKGNVESTAFRSRNEISAADDEIPSVDVLESHVVDMKSLDSQSEAVDKDQNYSKELETTQESVDKEEKKDITVTTGPSSVKTAEESRKPDCEADTNEKVSNNSFELDSNLKKSEECTEVKTVTTTEKSAIGKVEIDLEISPKHISSPKKNENKQIEGNTHNKQKDASDSDTTQVESKGQQQQKLPHSKESEQIQKDIQKSSSSIIPEEKIELNLLNIPKELIGPEIKKEDAPNSSNRHELGENTSDLKQIKVDTPTEKLKVKSIEETSTAKCGDTEKEKKPKRTPPKSEISARKTEKGRSAEEFDKMSSKEEKERILNSLYCPQKAAVRDPVKTVSTAPEKAKVLETIGKDKKLSKQSSQKSEPSSKAEKSKSPVTTIPEKVEERKSFTKDKIEEKRSSDSLNRSKTIAKESKLRDERSLNPFKSSVAKKEERFKDSTRDYKTHSKKDSRDDYSSRNYFKTDKYQKSKDFSRKDEDDRRDKKPRNESITAKEKVSSKSTHRSHEHSVHDRKKYGKDSPTDTKSRMARSYEDSKHKAYSIPKSSKTNTSERKSADPITSMKIEDNTAKLKTSKSDRKSSIKTNEREISDENKVNLEKKFNLESVAIKEDEVSNYERDSKPETPKLPEVKGSFKAPINACEDPKLKENQNDKPKLVVTESKEKDKKKSRWDDPKLPEGDENKQKKFKLDFDSIESSKTLKDDEKKNQESIEIKEQVKKDCQKNEDHTSDEVVESDSPKVVILDDPTHKTNCPLLSKAALKAYPIDLNFSALSSVIATTILSNVNQTTQPTDLNENFELEIDKESRPLISTENILSQVHREEIPQTDQVEIQKQDKSPSPKEDSQDSQEDSNNSNIRRSHRLKTISKTKQSVGRGLVRDKERFTDGDDRTQSCSMSAELEAENAKFLKDMEDRLSHFQIIKENDYKCERVISKEAKKMICDCFLTREEEDRGELGCGEDCLNRLLMIECGPRCVVGERCTNKRFTKNLYAPCKVFRTEKKGFGIMADGEILPGEFIMEYVGEVLDDKHFMKRAEIYSQDKNKHYYFMALRSDAIIDATAKGNISRFINHSCDPNAETQKWTVNGELRIGFFCRRKIFPGEEITFDYQFQRYGKEAQKCFCESANCRGWIGEEPDSEEEEEDEEISSESEEEEQIVPELGKDKPVVEEVGKDLIKAAEESIQIQAPPVPVPAPAAGAPLPVPPPVPMPVSPPIKEDDKPQEGLKAPIKPLSLIQEKVPQPVPKPKKIKPRKEFRFAKKKLEFLKDPDLEEEIEVLTRTGLKNQVHTLGLSRLMVRAKMLETRIRLLEILRTGEMPCRRLFLDYHGLRLLHGWMNENEIKDIEKDLGVRLLTVQTLEVLPIPNKTMLKESKVFQTVQSWAKDKEFQSLSPNDDSPSDSGSATPIISEGQEIKKVYETPAHVSGNVNLLRTEIMLISKKLLSSWDELPEVFRIPKRERIEQMKEHEREADRQYKALNRVDEESDRLSLKRRSERFGKTKKRSKSKKTANNNNNNNKYKWTRDQSDKDKKAKEKDKESEKMEIDPNLTKVQRRQLFAAKVAKDEEEKRLAEERREFEIKCKFYGLDPVKIQLKDLPFCVNPATGQWYTGDKKTIETPPSHAHIQVPPKPQSTDPKDYNLPSMDLPPLWKFAIDPRGRIYYYHIKIRIPQWEPPIKIEPLTGGTDQISDEPVPSTSKTALDASSNRNYESSSSTDSDESVPESKIRKIDDASTNDAEVEAKRERRKERYSLLVQERAISPRRDEDRLYNQLEMRRYKENKEKIRKRREEIKRKKAQLLKDGSLNISTEADRSHDGLPLPIQDYLFSSDEEEHLKSDCDSPLLEKFVQGDKIVDELDALKKERSLKRPLPIKDKPEYKKRQKVEERKRPEETKSISQKSSKHSNLKYLARKAKEKFRCDIAGVIVQHLTPYRKESCQIGRITNNEDFKHLARKLTHFVMIKELKHCGSTGQILEVTESVKNKSREFIKKYMAKYGGIYIRPENDPEFKDIPH